MKRLLAVLSFLIFAASFAHADTINLLACSNCVFADSWADVYTFPPNSYYTPSYGSSMIDAGGETYGGVSGYNWWQSEAWGGTTKGSITKFSYASLYSSQLNADISLFNSVFNSRTDTFKASFVFGGKMWHLTEVFGAPQSAFSNVLYSYTYSNITSAQITTVPEPGSLWLMGTGLLSLGGFARRRFLS